ncbi:tRNA (adenosine(37)-N6)-threonylcarbamoyltransferase complex dimerization subunit type 1 TsaB [Steroidobacter agaridevorans]|uniref:tRNA (adenosine(37)-N6)-threonylcarbamoyltransferase complex dimerization subunit type 1 TsaB n=1 Tax=Steroidobacter agaridevorans TaxID=2695856 RepID=UPI001327E805|nr:tRNA (adenosine(37)-N6)-threonylcarbamoyltransferase complex dimerization subunit type 1 TsaB [Steroidobacter agaridevorans]GFE87822.1 tRNA threonylcarbamoyladenosine biosynthesis protein TsaB [Steroidobacter agaridevorans]
MRLLAIDTATERCSVALRLDGKVIERSSEQPRGAADLVLPMVDSVLQEAGVRLADLDGIAYGRGPGAFTGVRIGVGVVQGLAFGVGLQTVGISNLAAVAQQVAQPGDRILVCMDARMDQVYWSSFAREHGADLVTPLSAERVDAPDAVVDGNYTVVAGTGFKAYPKLRARLATGDRIVHEAALPKASDIALLAEAEFRAGRARPAAEAEPVYVRDQVAHVKGA